MYQSYLRRDLEKRIRKDRKMYMLPLGVAVTVGLVLSISTLLRSINGSVTLTTQDVNCNRTSAAVLLDFCDSNVEERLDNVTFERFGIPEAILMKCCVREAWKKCMDQALLKSGCGQDNEVNTLVKMLAKRVEFHWRVIVCWRSCDSEEETRKMLANLEKLMTSRIGMSTASEGGSQRKLKKWNGANWNDEIVSDNNTSEGDDDSDENDLDQLIANMTRDDNLEDDTFSTTLPTTTTLMQTIASTPSTTEHAVTSTDCTTTNCLVVNITTAISKDVAIDEIDSLVEEEEDNVQEDDTIFNETKIDTSDFIEGTRKMKALVNNNSGYLIEVNFLLAFINIFCYTAFILFEYI